MKLRPVRLRIMKQGFTLIELAVVIAVIAILAAIAIPRLFDLTDGAQITTARDFLNQLRSSVAMYTASTGVYPTGLGNFVDVSSNPPQPPFTISTIPVGYGGCTLASHTTVNCDAAFPSLTRVRYTYQDGVLSADIQE